jgi:hypothetical protein
MYDGVYRDDGLAAFIGNRTTSEMAEWLGTFQTRVDEIAESNFLKFTAEVWGRDKDDGRKYKSVTVRDGDSFPFLDMEMYWSPDDELQFRVHMKENQALKYLNRGSAHRESCFAAIPTGVLKRLASLTTRTEESEMKTMDELYPAHAQALRTGQARARHFSNFGRDS